MARKPQPDRRQGLIRAAIAVVIMLVLLAAALAIVSAATTPSVNAPTAPNTPGPLKTTVPVTPLATQPPTPKPTAKPTPRKKGALGDGSPALLSAPYELMSRIHLRAISAAPVAYFTHPAGSPYGTLLIRTTRGVVRVGSADTLSRPVWSADQTRVLFVREHSAAGIPGARWTILQYDLASRRVSRLAGANGLNAQALGWIGGEAVFAVARSTDTSVYRAGPHGVHHISILMPEPITGAQLSPDGRYIAFDTPAGCAYCVTNVFDFATYYARQVAVGGASADVLLWTGTHQLVTVDQGRLVAVDAASGARGAYVLPARLAALWSDPLSARVSAQALRITDERTGVWMSARANAGG